MRTPVVSIQTHTSEPLRAGGQTIRLVARSISVELPIETGGVIWTSPDSVLVRSADGAERVLPVRDWTRWIEFGLWALLALALPAIVSGILRRRTNTAPSKGVHL